MSTEGLRLTDVLTTGTTVANYLGETTVRAEHLQTAIGLLCEKLTMDDLGRPQSPTLSRMTKAGSAVAPDVRELAQRWFARLGGDPRAEFDAAGLAEFELELAALVADAPSPEK